MDRSHEVRDISFSDNKMRLLVDGRAYEVDISQHSAKLANASSDQRSHFVLSPAGYGIHWPSIDEDLSIDGLIGISHKCPVAKSAH
ncbi:MAG: DUF2442 domain-containing protein [Elusimicrobia bacterium]|nr:DUF2442 domain-containing protein [Elusimicrobiota bacterium]